MRHLFLVLMFNSEENDVKAVFHEPHPEKETDKGAVKSVREFLLKAGIEPETFESETFVNDNE